MAMAAIGLSTNLKDIRNMGYKPFVVGFTAMLTVRSCEYYNYRNLYKIFYLDCLTGFLKYFFSKL